MTSPAFALGTTHSSGSGSTSRNISFGFTASAGDRLILPPHYRDGTITAPSSPWAQISGATATQSNFEFRGWYLDASGGETSVTLTTQSAVVVIIVPMRIPAGTFDAATPPECTTATFTDNPPSETASWGSGPDNGWVATMGCNGSAIDGYPTGFTDDQRAVTSTFDSLNIAICTKADAVATLDPSAFTSGGVSPGGSRSIAATIVVRGAAAAATGRPVRRRRQPHQYGLIVR